MARESLYNLLSVLNQYLNRYISITSGRARQGERRDIFAFASSNRCYNSKSSINPAIVVYWIRKLLISSSVLSQTQDNFAKFRCWTMSPILIKQIASGVLTSSMIYQDTKWCTYSSQKTVNLDAWDNRRAEAAFTSMKCKAPSPHTVYT